MRAVKIMKLEVAMLLTIVSAAGASAQEQTNVIYQAQAGTAVGMAIAGRDLRAPVLGAPYSATLTNESVQTLVDGNRIVESSTGMTARDSQGRTRQDAPMPMIANMAPANAPHIVIINDPVAQKTYMLNFTDKTARAASTNSPAMVGGNVTSGSGGAGGEAYVFHMQIAGPPPGGSDPAAPGLFAQKVISTNDAEPPQTEDLGTQTMEGVMVTGTRTTRTIPAGQIGNEKPITIVTEVWTSPELHTVVMSKRSDPRMGEQTFQLTNIVRSEPDPSLFTVPSDFKVVDAGQPGNGPVIVRSRP
jgi:hypothetical protein